jgi:hypothetical protein
MDAFQKQVHKRSNQRDEPMRDEIDRNYMRIKNIQAQMRAIYSSGKFYSFDQDTMQLMAKLNSEHVQLLKRELALTHRMREHFNMERRAPSRL